MRNKNRTTTGDRLKRSHQERYEKWWLNKTVTEINFQKVAPPEKIVCVEYIGNSVGGVVRLFTESGREFALGGADGGYRPQKYLVKII